MEWRNQVAVVTGGARGIGRAMALALHRFVREPLELDGKWMSQAHLTLRRYQACGIFFKGNAPLSACASPQKSSPQWAHSCSATSQR
jgi:hypothetical protein